MYLIYEIYPTFCPIRDCQTGMQAEDIGRRFYREDYARKMAARIAEQHNADGGESTFIVRPVGVSAFSCRVPADWGMTAPNPDDLPF